MPKAKRSVRDQVAPLAAFVLAAVLTFTSCRSAVKGGSGEGGIDRTEEAAELGAAVHYSELADSLLPAVAALVGVSPGEPVDVVVRTRREMDAVLWRILAREYPGDELALRARCLGELGLLPRGIDFAREVVAVAGEQMGALYDPYSKAIYAIRDLDPDLEAAGMERIIVAHELTHALQDRVSDIPTQDSRCLEDLDYEFALHAILEGMAVVVMTANAGGHDVKMLPDLSAQLGDRVFAGETPPALRGLGRAPRYLRESLTRPYSDGAGFVQAWLRANPRESPADLLGSLPVTSEQVLHYDRYAAGDLPDSVDLAPARAVLAPHWEPFYGNSLGEFDLGVLFDDRGATAARSRDIAAGWDGLRFEGYEDSKGRTAIVAGSAWDTDEDAAEFEAALRSIMKDVQGGSRFDAVRRGDRVVFVTGPLDPELRRSAMASLFARDEAPGKR